ncbi:hypothetical protein OF83DRAFT_746667 [Amylostereum chailletii]|nr:hypothetical protein OF83DRAFT_746667 [Amylostereum chailletii]
MTALKLPSGRNTNHANLSALGHCEARLPCPGLRRFCTASSIKAGPISVVFPQVFTNSCTPFMTTALTTMRAFALFASLALAVSVSASPIVKRAPACAWNSVLDVPGFTLLAVNLGDQSVERSLVLGVIPGFQPNVSVLATNATVTKNLGWNFTMAEGGVTAEPVEGSDDPQQSMYVALQNSLLEFLSKSASVTQKPVKSYCELFNTSPHGTEYPYVLGVNGDSDGFSICKSKTTDVDVVVYKPANGTALPYDPETCESVVIHPIHPSP